jgi:hypothetical protein
VNPQAGATQEIPVLYVVVGSTYAPTQDLISQRDGVTSSLVGFSRRNRARGAPLWNTGAPGEKEVDWKHQESQQLRVCMASFVPNGKRRLIKDKKGSLKSNWYQ